MQGSAVIDYRATCVYRIGKQINFAQATFEDSKGAYAILQLSTDSSPQITYMLNWKIILLYNTKHEQFFIYSRAWYIK